MLMHNNVNQALLFLIDTVFALYIIVVMLRVLLQLVHADFRNPISQFVYQATNPPLRPLTRIVPRWRQLDIAAIILVLVLCVINIELNLLLLSLPSSASTAAVLGWSALKALVLLCNLFTFTILIQALASWLAPGAHSPATAVLWSINEPLLRPVRNVVPVIGGLDISPLIVIIALQVISRLLPLPGLLR